MPDADSLLMEAQQAKRRITEMQEADAAKYEYSKHANTAGRLYRLKTNEDFLWFLDEFLQPFIDEEDRILNDPKTPDRERSDACHRKDIAKTIHGLAESKHKEFLAKSNPTKP